MKKNFKSVTPYALEPPPMSQTVIPSQTPSLTLERYVLHCCLGCSAGQCRSLTSFRGRRHFSLF